MSISHPPGAQEPQVVQRASRGSLSPQRLQLAYLAVVILSAAHIIGRTLALVRTYAAERCMKGRAPSVDATRVSPVTPDHSSSNPADAQRTAVCITPAALASPPLQAVARQDATARAHTLLRLLLLLI